jgi:hypothetical protein
VVSSDAVERLRRLEQAAWVLNVYPTAGEASGCFLAVGARRGGGGVRGLAADPERAALEAGRRARGVVRRYAAANALTRFGTLTYRGEGCFDQEALRADLAEFFRRVRAELGPVPYLWVPEWHKTHGLHAHFALDRFAHQQMLQRVWGHGYVGIKRLSGARSGDGSWQAARVASGYLAKYVTKTFEDDAEDKRRLFGLHRYERAEGFNPPVRRLRGSSMADLLGQACHIMGGGWSREWFSRDVEGWRGPPAYWLQWGTRR